MKLGNNVFKKININSMSKKIITICAALIITVSIWAQSPQKMSYQAVIRNNSGALVSSSTVGMRISIIQSTIFGVSVYVETHTISTNANGLVSLQIGAGTPISGTFASIDWSNGPYFIKTETDPTGGTTYSITGTSELLSVPYALNSADNKWTSTGTNISNNNTGNVGIGISAPNPTAYGYSGTNKVLEISNTVSNSHSQLVLSSEISNIGNTGGISFVNKTAPVSEKRMAGITSQYNDDSLDYDMDAINELGGSLDFWTNKDGIYSQKMKITIDGDIGIGTTTPSTKLDVLGKTSTTELQVTSGAGTGKVLTSDAAGNATWQTVGLPIHYIGESYGGGIVFYVYDGGQHGLIAATADQSTGIQWFNGTNRFTGTTGDGLNAGAMNTAMIVAAQMADNPTGNFAAKVCADYTVIVGGVTYGDWYLPSKEELNLLYLQNSVVGGFANNYYWSSTEINANTSWSFNFSLGSASNGTKNFPIYVRAIRAF